MASNAYDSVSCLHRGSKIRQMFDLVLDCSDDLVKQMLKFFMLTLVPKITSVLKIKFFDASISDSFKRIILDTSA